MRPEGSKLDRIMAHYSRNIFDDLWSNLALRGVDKFGNPVHEEITNIIFGCDGNFNGSCQEPDWEPNLFYIQYGVRWNDDPAFKFEKKLGDFGGCKSGSTVRLVTYPRCWVNIFKDAKEKAENGILLNQENSALLARSHFGDLQFLHSMASKDGESPLTIRDKIYSWAEFTWNISIGEISPSLLMKDVGIFDIVDLFGDSGLSIQELFALGDNNARKSRNIKDVAFGSLLHVIEDSFANGHVERRQINSSEECQTATGIYKAPGKILEFHSYSHQDSEKHKEDDSREAFLFNRTNSDPDVVDVGLTLSNFYERKAPWSEVGEYIKCVFMLDPEVRASSPGEKYEK